MRFRLDESLGIYQGGVRELFKEKGYEEETDGLPIFHKEANEVELRVSVSAEKITIEAGSGVSLFRGLAKAFQWLEQNSEKEAGKYCLEEKAGFTSCGVMFDCSRNGVLQVDSVKAYLRKMAQLGLNTMMLYLEDTYELKEYPYFGHLRGRYTQEELKECDAYAQLFGIEIVPAIQTLAHLHTPLRFPAFRELRDTEDILLVGSEKVYELIEAMLRTLSGCFRSKRIHLGMDEAHSLGLGEYLNRHGFTERFQIMNSHLNRVKSICDTLGLKPAIWSDMYFRLLSPNGDYYNIPFDTKERDMTRPPEGIELMYWDYYHDDAEYYANYIRLHRKLSDRISFAGGGWIWNGIAPNYSKMEATTEAAFRACREEKLDTVVCTLWQDNGAETPAAAGEPAIALLASYCYGGEGDRDAMKADYAFVFGRSWDDSMLLDRFDAVEGTLPHNQGQDNPSKYLLYQDPMAGLFDAQIKGCGLAGHYRMLADSLAGIDDRGQLPLFAYYHTLAQVLTDKAELGLWIREAYLQKNREELRKIAETVIPRCVSATERLVEYRRQIWFRECRPNGFEILDIRLHGVIARLRSTALRINHFLSGETDSLEELEEERLVFRRDDRNPEHTQCCGPFWQDLVSAGNMAGI